MSRMRAVALFLLCAATISPAPLPAASPSKSAEAARSACLAGRFEEALAGYRQALSAESDEAGRALLHFNAGTCLIALKRPAEAREELTLSLASPEKGIHPLALYNLAHALAASEERDKALEALRACLSLDPSNRDAKLFYEWLLRQKPPEDQPPPDQPPPEGPPPPSPPMPDLLEQLPQPPAKEMQDEVRPPQSEAAPGQKPW